MVAKVASKYMPPSTSHKADGRVRVQVLKVVKVDGAVETGLKAWRYVLRKFGVERTDAELDVMLLDYWH